MDQQSKTPKQAKNLTWAQRTVRNSRRARSTTMAVIGVFLFFATLSINSLVITLCALGLAVACGIWAYLDWKS